VIFFHGCFWHGHEPLRHFRLPTSRREWWSAKIEGNRGRDLRVQNELLALGWHVITIWECSRKTQAAREWLEATLPKLLGRRKAVAP
jgi:DNA mismatch endonuclease (patch repair protein)